MSRSPPRHRRGQYYDRDAAGLGEREPTQGYGRDSGQYPPARSPRRGHRDGHRSPERRYKEASRSPDRRYRPSRQEEEGGQRRRGYGRERERGRGDEERSYQRPRSRTPERHRDGRDYRDHRDRRDEGRYGRASPSPTRKERRPIERTASSPRSKTVHVQVESKPVVGADDEEMGVQEQDMMAMMGFAGFDTTKDKKVIDADVGAVDVKKKRVYRQYMNRKGGFNRPLDHVQ